MISSNKFCGFLLYFSTAVLFNVILIASIYSSMSTIKWCCHPTRHQGDRRMAPDRPDKHQKGKTQISSELACFINEAYSLQDYTNVINRTSNLLCTLCLNFKTSRMDSVGPSHKVNTREATRSKARADVILASIRISDQSGNGSPTSTDDFYSEWSI